MTNEYKIFGDITVIKIVGTRSKCSVSAIIDTIDLDKVSAIDGAWIPCYSKEIKSYYVVTNVKLEKPGRFGRKHKLISMHRILFGDECIGKVVDHINHDTLDNRRSKNLRVVTQAENHRNTKKKYLASKNTA